MSDENPKASPGPDEEAEDGVPLPIETALMQRQAAAIEALLREPTMTRAADAAGVTDRTLRRWMTQLPFRAKLLSARRDSFSQAVGLTQRYASMAVATLVKVMNDPKGPASAKVTAAAVLLRFGRDGVELEDLSERVAALEQAAGVPPQTATQPQWKEDEP